MSAVRSFCVLRPPVHSDGDLKPTVNKYALMLPPFFLEHQVQKLRNRVGNADPLQAHCFAFKVTEQGFFARPLKGFQPLDEQGPQT